MFLHLCTSLAFLPSSHILLLLRVSICGVVDVEGVGGGRTDGHDARPEFDADGYVVVGDEAAFAEADGEGGFTAAAVAEGHDLGDVVPWLGGHTCGRIVAWGSRRCEGITVFRRLFARFGNRFVCLCLSWLLSQDPDVAVTDLDADL